MYKTIIERWFQIEKKIPNSSFKLIKLENLVLEKTETINSICEYINIPFEKENDALPDDIEMLFTDIVSQNISATRIDGEWVGSLANNGWQQLWGYWVRVSENLTFSFEYDENLPRFANNQAPNYHIINDFNGQKPAHRMKVLNY